MGGRAGDKAPTHSVGLIPSIDRRGQARRIRNLYYVTRPHKHTVEANSECYDLCLIQLGVKRPPTNTLRLCARRATKCGQLQLAYTVAPHGVDILNILVVGLVRLTRVGPGNDCYRVSILDRAALVVERAVHHVCRCVLHNDWARAILYHAKPCAVPQTHATENTDDVPHHVQCLITVVEQAVEGEARLEPAGAVRHHLVTVFSDPVQLVVINLRNVHIFAKTVPLAEQQVAQTPRRVVRPHSHVRETAVPNCWVGAGYWVIAVWHPHFQQLHEVLASRHAAELLGLYLEADNSRVWVPHLCADLLDIATPVDVATEAVRTVLPGVSAPCFGHTELSVSQPGCGRCWQLDAERFLNLRRYLVVAVDAENFSPASCVSACLDRQGPGVCLHVAVFIRMVHFGDVDDHDNMGHFNVVDLAYNRDRRLRTYRCRRAATDQLGADRYVGFSHIEPLQRRLIGCTVVEGVLETGKVLGTIRIHDRRTFEKYRPLRLSWSGKPFNWPFAQQLNHPGCCARPHRLVINPWLARATAAGTNNL